jgi:hypothetical protein
VPVCFKVYLASLFKIAKTEAKEKNYGVEKA